MSQPRQPSTRSDAETASDDDIAILHPAIQDFLDALAAWRYRRALAGKQDAASAMRHSERGNVTAVVETQSYSATGARDAAVM